MSEHTLAAPNTRASGKRRRIGTDEIDETCEMELEECEMKGSQIASTEEDRMNVGAENTSIIDVVTPDEDEFPQPCGEQPVSEENTASAIHEGLNNFDRVRKFPEKLWEAVHHDSDSLVWSDDGLSVVVDEGKFVEEVMQLHPGLVQIPSFPNFRRQMREYGFQWGIVENYVFYFTHPYFQRAKPNLLPQVQTRRHTRNKLMGIEPSQGVGRPRKTSTKIAVRYLPPTSATINSAVDGITGLTQEHISMFLKALTQLPNVKTCCKHQEGSFHNQLSEYMKRTNMPSEAGDAAQYMSVPPHAAYTNNGGNQNCNNNCNGSGSENEAQASTSSGRIQSTGAVHGSSNGSLYGPSNTDQPPYYQPGNSYQGPGAVWPMPVPNGLYSNPGYWFPSPNLMCVPAMSNFSDQSQHQAVDVKPCENNSASSQESEDTGSLYSSQTSSIFQSDSQPVTCGNGQPIEVTKTSVSQDQGCTLIVQPKEEDATVPLVIGESVLTKTSDACIHTKCNEENIFNPQGSQESNESDDQGITVRLNPEHVPINGGSQGFRIHLRHLQPEHDSDTTDKVMPEDMAETDKLTVDGEQ